jgi:hypothetical protein
MRGIAVPLRETALHINASTLLPRQREHLQRLANRVRSAFDAQIPHSSFDTGDVRKINVEMYAIQPVPEFNPPDRTLLPDDRIAVTAEPIDLDLLFEASVEEQATQLLNVHIRGLCHLARRYGWDATEFEEAGQRAQGGGVLARMHREKQNRARSHRATIDGSVEIDGIHLTMSVCDRRSGDLIATEHRKTFGDYWDMLDTAHDLRWADGTVELISKPRALGVGTRWRLSV